MSAARKVKHGIGEKAGETERGWEEMGAVWPWPGPKHVGTRRKPRRGSSCSLCSTIKEWVGGKGSLAPASCFYLAPIQYNEDCVGGPSSEAYPGSGPTSKDFEKEGREPC